MSDKFLTHCVARIISFILLIVCAYMVFWEGTICIGILNGEVEMRFENGERGFLCGEKPAAWVALPETVYLDGEVDGAVYAGVCAMGLDRQLPFIAVYAMLCVLLFNGVRGRLISKQNETLLMICGVVTVLAAVLIPLINYYAIPAMLAPRRVDVSLDISKGPHVWQGLALVLAADVIKQGRKAKEMSQT